MTYLIVNPCLFTFKCKYHLKTELCDFAYVLCTKYKLLKQHGFPIKNPLSYNEQNIVLQSTGISNGISGAYGKSVYEGMHIFYNLLKNLPESSQLIIVNYNKFNQLLLRYRAETDNILYYHIIKILKTMDIINYDENNFRHKSNIAISDCLTIFDTLIKNG